VLKSPLSAQNCLALRTASDFTYGFRIRTAGPGTSITSCATAVSCLFYGFGLRDEAALDRMEAAAGPSYLDCLFDHQLAAFAPMPLCTPCVHPKRLHGTGVPPAASPGV
jgi:hypothetical protein